MSPNFLLSLRWITKYNLLIEFNTFYILIDYVILCQVVSFLSCSYMFKYIHIFLSISYLYIQRILKKELYSLILLLQHVKKIIIDN